MKETKATYFASVKSVDPIDDLPLFDLCTTPKWKEMVECLRACDQESQHYRDIKEKLPCFTPSIQCTQRADRYMTQHTGRVCLDFDHVADPQLFKEELSQMKYVEFAALSCSGTGVYALVKIDKPQLHKQHYKALLTYFARHGFDADPSCSNLSRLRIVSYDPDYYYNDRATVWTKTEVPYPVVAGVRSSTSYSGNFHTQAIYRVRDYVVANGIDITSGRSYWIGIGAHIFDTLGADEGKRVFREVSQMHPRFTDKEFDQCWSYICRSTLNSNFGSLLNACSRSGVPTVKELLAGGLS